MTTLLEQAVAQLRELSEDFQDKAARQLIRYVDEISTVDRVTVDEGHRAPPARRIRTARPTAA